MTSGWFRQETPGRIWDWNQQTFGKPKVRDIANRTNLEVAELLIAIQFGYAREKILEELADVAIMTWAVAAGLGVDARPVVMDKHRPVDFEDPFILATKLNTKWAMVMANFAMRNRTRELRASFCWAMRYLEMLIEYYGVDITALVDAKMVINRQRIWKNVSNGNYQHVA